MAIRDQEKRREYHRAYMRRYLENPDTRAKHLARVRKNNAAQRDVAREVVAEFKKSGCVKCGESAFECLDAHHIDEATKDFDIGGATRWRYSPDRIREELSKCVCLCANCHRKVHAGTLTL
ncbi:MAG: hypothetical protein KDE45_22600 [Caldilineaceae bacterium]|nr:hypothetical protein [Caldilineaceae bacterium]